MRIGDFEVEPVEVGWRVYRHSKQSAKHKASNRVNDPNYYLRLDHIAAHLADEMAEDAARLSANLDEFEREAAKILAGLRADAA